jgi:hypothetical protein
MAQCISDQRILVNQNDEHGSFTFLKQVRMRSALKKWAARLAERPRFALGSLLAATARQHHHAEGCRHEPRQAGAHDRAWHLCRVVGHE